MEKDLYIGLDISTTAAKAIAVDLSGAVVESVSTALTLETPQAGWAEQQPEAWWAAACVSLQQLTAGIDPARIGGMGLTGQMLGLVALDSQGKPVRPAILWNDQRSERQCAEFTEKVGLPSLAQIAGSRLLPGMTLPKMLWMQRHEPEMWNTVACVLLPKDYIGYRLTGEQATEVTDASGIGLLDVGERGWSSLLIEAAGVEAERLPKVLESNEVVGEVTAAAAEVTGLPAGIPVTAGAGDQPAQALGAGVVAAGDSALTLGTSGVFFQAADRYAPDPEGRLHTFCHAAPGMWCYMGVMLSAAGSLQWLRDGVFPQHSFAELDTAASSVSAGAKNLLFAPYLTGERHPHGDAEVRGAFIGLDRRHGQGHFARAVLEGVAFGLRDLIELARDQGIVTHKILLSGGGAANSVLWRSILANVLNLPLTIVQTGEGAAMGAALLSMQSAGRSHSLVAAEGETAEPDQSQSTVYEARYRQWRELYPVLAALNRNEHSSH